MNTWENKFQLKGGQCDRYGRWKVSDMLLVMQEAAGIHSELMGCGRGKLHQEDCIWIVTRSELHITRYGRFMDWVVVRTFPVTNRRFFYPRFFTFETLEGEYLGHAVSYWAIMNTREQRMVSLDWVNQLIPSNEDMTRPMGYPGSATVVDASEERTPYLPLYSDLDMNGHVNNTKSAEWLCNLLGAKVLKHRPLASLVMNYNREIRGEKALDLSLRKTEEAFSLRVLRDESSFVDMSGTFMETDAQGGRPSPIVAPDPEDL